MNMVWLEAPWRLCAGLVAATLLVAGCGGESDLTPVAPPAGPVTVTGTAATGDAIAGGTVEIRCWVGSASTTTADDGTYSVQLPDDTVLPCVLRVTATDGSKLHSVLGGDASVANLTPVTELVVAWLSQGSPADYFGAFDEVAAETLANTDITGAADAVVAILAAAGVDFGPDTTDSVLAGELIAAYGGQPGNTYDQKLTELAAKLAASGTTLATLTDEVARSAPTDAQAGLSSQPSLPADLLLAPAAPNCVSLRSGSYRWLVLAAGSVTTDVVEVDAAGLTLTRSSGAVETWTASGDCTFTTGAGQQAVVSAAGIVTARAAAGSGFAAALLFPEQVLLDSEGHPDAPANVAQLAGNWNDLALKSTTSGGPVHLTTSTFTLNGAGVLRALTTCTAAVTDCTTLTLDQLPVVTYAYDAAGGGFTVTNTTDGSSARAFVYRAGGGELMIVSLSSDGQLAFATRQLTATLPAVDSVRLSWELALDAGLSAATGFVDGESIVSAVDEAQMLYVSTVLIDAGTGTTRPETIAINNPRDGYRYRAQATVDDSNGAPSAVSEQVALPLLGMGLVPVGGVADNGLTLSVSRPGP